MLSCQRISRQRPMKYQPFRWKVLPHCTCSRGIRFFPQGMQSLQLVDFDVFHNNSCRALLFSFYEEYIRIVAVVVFIQSIIKALFDIK